MWEFRYYQTLGQSRPRRTATVGTVEEYPAKAAAREAVAALLLKLNSEDSTAGTVTFAAVVDRYLTEELPERFTTRESYLSVVNTHIRPKWADFPLDEIKPIAVEDWLRNLPLAPKSSANARSIMHLIFKCAERWELIEFGKTPSPWCGSRGVPIASRHLVC